MKKFLIIVSSILLLSACASQKSVQDNLNEKTSNFEETDSEIEKNDIEPENAKSQKITTDMEEQNDNQVFVTKFTEDEKREMIPIFYEWAC